MKKNIRASNQQSIWRTNSGIERPHENDILCGRGGTSIHNSGNVRFRAMVKEYKMVYQTYTRLQKTTLAETLLKEWQTQNPPGRFLDRDDRTGLWYCIPIKAARKKVSQLLREGAPKIRTQLKTESDKQKKHRQQHQQRSNMAAVSARRSPPPPIVTPPIAHRMGKTPATDVGFPEDTLPPFPSPVHTEFAKSTNENSPPPTNQPDPTYLYHHMELPTKPAPQAQSQSPESVLDLQLNDMIETPSWDSRDAFDDIFVLDDFGPPTTFEHKLPKPQVLQYRKSNESVSSTGSWFPQASTGATTVTHPSPRSIDIWEPLALSSIGSNPDYSSAFRGCSGSCGGEGGFDTSTIDILNDLDRELERGLIDGLS